MEMKIIKLSVSNQKLTVEAPFDIVAGTSGRYGVKVTYDAEWDAAPYRVVQFNGCEIKKADDTGDIVPVPWECIKTPCYLKFAILGLDGNGNIRITTNSKDVLEVLPEGWKDGIGKDELLPPTQNMWEVEKAKYEKLEEMMNGIIDGSLTEVTSNVGSIRNSAFQNCPNLLEAYFPLARSVGANAFYSCKNLTTISFPSVTTINSSAFNYCNITSADFPSANYIANNAFYECRNLATVNFPLAARIQYNAFLGCSNLVDAYFPLVTEIGYNGFYNSTKLTTVNFPSLTSMSYGIFQHCSSLTTVILGNTKSVCSLSNTNTFSDTPIATSIEPVNLLYNLATNGDFSKGKEGWSSNYDVDNHPAVTDGYGVYSGRWNCYSGATYRIDRSFYAGEVIEFEFDVKLARNYPSNGDISFSYWFESNDGVEGTKYRCYDVNGNTVYGNADDWTRVKGKYTIPRATNNLTMYIAEGPGYSGDRKGDFYIDNLYIGTGEVRRIGDSVLGYNVDTESLDATLPWGTGVVIKAPTGYNFNKVEVVYESDSPLNVFLFDSKFTDGLAQNAPGQHEVFPKISTSDTDHSITWEYTEDVVKAIKFVSLDGDAELKIKSVKFIGKGKVGYIYVPKELIEDYKKATNWTTYANHFRAIEDYPEICENNRQLTAT